MRPEQRHPVVSEDLEPFAAYLLGVLGMRVMAAHQTNDPDLDGYCMRLWWGLRGLREIGIAVGNVPHFSVCTSNEEQRAAALITALIGVDPYTDPRFKI